MKRLTVAAVLLLTLAVHSHAIAADRYCGTSSKWTATTVTYYVSAAWNRPGYRLMSVRKHWSATPRYYTCRPR